MDASIVYPIIVNPRFMFIPGIGTTWANAQYNNNFYGVNGEQSLASGFAVFRPGSGFKDASLFVTASYKLTDHINLNASGGVTTVLGDNNDSPLVSHKTQGLGAVSLMYNF